MLSEPEVGNEAWILQEELPVLSTADESCQGQRDEAS